MTGTTTCAIICAISVASGHEGRRHVISEENKALYRRVVDEVFTNGNVDLIDDLIDPNWVDHSPVPGQEPGLDGLKKMVIIFRTTFPDLRSTVEDLIAEGDKVVGRRTTTGTHQGEFMGIAPTNKRVTISEIHIVRIANSKAVEHWGLSDDLGMMQQLGVIPS